MTVIRHSLQYLKEAPGSIRGILFADEKVRVLLSALAAGSTASISAAVLSFFGVVDPEVVSVVSLFVPAVVGLLDYLRRKYIHGKVVVTWPTGRSSPGS